MKKILVLSLVLILVLSAIPMASAEKYVVTTKQTNLNMRSAPQGEILPGGLPKDSVIEVLNVVEYKGAKWAVLENNGQLVYAFMEYEGVRYLTKVTDANAIPSTVNTTTQTTTEKKPGGDIEVLAGLDPTKEYEGELYVVNLEKGTLNVRRGPGKSHKISVRLLPGSYVEVISTEGKWAKVHYRTGKVGWVMLEYITPAISQ